ncbi:efflux pump [Apiospora arundinis]|uniref:Efflux pump n=1 Tax=Apiospora arundinis TaxID=335852 RepID=A0ABR2I3L7_9PEZI
MARTYCFNLISGLVFITAFVCLLLVLQWGGTAYPWTEGRIVALFVFSSVVMNLVLGMLVKVPSYHTPFVVLRTVLKAIEAVIMSLWNPNTTVPVWVVCQILFGAGCGMSLQQPIIAVQTVLDIRDVAVGTTLTTSLQPLGSVLLVSIVNSVSWSQLATALAGYASEVDSEMVPWLARRASGLQCRRVRSRLPYKAMTRRWRMYFSPALAWRPRSWGALRWSGEEKRKGAKEDGCQKA